MANEAAKIVGKWKMHRPLEKGAFGMAWLAEDTTKPGVYAVLKFLSGSPLEEDISVTKARFAREREILAGLDNQHLCRLLDDDLDFNPPWVAVDYLPGKSLKGTISENYKLDETEWFRLANDLLNGLSYLHKQKIIHRDLNYGNILVTSLGYKIIDFGISYKQGLPTVTTGQLRHTFFTSPEQLLKDGKITTKSDIFSLATLLVYAGTNRSPWTNDPSAMTENISPLAMYEIPNNTVNSEPIYHSLSTNQKLFLRELHRKEASARPTANEALELLRKLATRAFLSPVTNAPPAQKQAQPPKPAPRVVKRTAAPVKREMPVIKAPAKKALPSQSPRLKVSQDRVDAVETPTKSATASFIEKHWKDLLIGWIFTPLGWLGYRHFKKRKDEGSQIAVVASAKNLKIWKITYLATHALTAGLFAPIPGITLAIKQKNRATSIFIASNTLSVFLIFNAIIETPSGGEIPTGSTVLLIFNYIFGFFLPIAMKLKPKSREITSANSAPVPSKAAKLGEEDSTENVLSTERIDPFDNEESLADAHEEYQLLMDRNQTWESLKESVRDVLEYETLERFSISFSKTNVAGIYFQGYLEEDGAITIEAAANLSVRPRITTEQNARIIQLGWAPPAKNLPNYLRFLEVEESTLDHVATLVVSTLRDGYGASLVGLEPMFSVATGEGTIYVNFEEFKRLMAN